MMTPTMFNEAMLSNAQITELLYYAKHPEEVEKDSEFYYLFNK